jgi:hypothetical protein
MVGMGVLVSRQRRTSEKNAKNDWWKLGESESTRTDGVNGQIDRIHKVSNSKTDLSFDVIDYESGRGSESRLSMMGYGALGTRGGVLDYDDTTDSSLINEQSRLLETSYDTSSRINKYSS